METPENTLSTQNVVSPVTFLQSNIVEDQLKLNLQQTINNLVIYNQLGQKMLHLKNVKKSFLNLNIENFSTGIYFIKVDEFSPVRFLKL